LPSNCDSVLTNRVIGELISHVDMTIFLPTTWDVRFHAGTKSYFDVVPSAAMDAKNITMLGGSHINSRCSPPFPPRKANLSGLALTGSGTFRAQLGARGWDRRGISGPEDMLSLRQNLLIEHGRQR